MINPNFSVVQVAEAIREAINSETAQKILKVTASTTERDPDSNPQAGLLQALVNLHGSVAENVFGDLALAPTLSFRRYGTDSPFGEDLGDSNRLRDQGQVVISSTVFRDNAGFGSWSMPAAVIVAICRRIQVHVSILEVLAILWCSIIRASRQGRDRQQHRRQ